MEFQIGDPVIHWAHGLGKIVGLEERDVADQKKLYYVVQIQKMTIWVPADDQAESRLRAPTPRNEIPKLFDILSESGESLSLDRLERKTQLRKELANGKAETICRVIRDLSSHAKKKTLNDDDRMIMERAWNLLCREWEYSLAQPYPEVEAKLRLLLTHPSENSVV